MAIFAEVTENERIIDRHLRGIHPLLDYDASESQSVISIWFDLIEIGLSALYGVMFTQNWTTLQCGFSAIAELLVIPYERKIHLVFWHEEWLVDGGGWTLVPEILGQNDRHRFKNGDCQSIFAHSTSVLTPSEKSSIMTNRKSTTSFPMSLAHTEQVAQIDSDSNELKWNCICINALCLCSFVS